MQYVLPRGTVSSGGRGVAPVIATDVYKLGLFHIAVSRDERDALRKDDWDRVVSGGESSFVAVWFARLAGVRLWPAGHDQRKTHSSRAG